jgi:hypothetical protein
MSPTPSGETAWRLQAAESNLAKLELEFKEMEDRIALIVAANVAKERRYLVSGISALGGVIVILAGVLWKNLPEIIR